MPKIKSLSFVVAKKNDIKKTLDRLQECFMYDFVSPDATQLQMTYKWNAKMVFAIAMHGDFLTLFLLLWFELFLNL